MNDMICRNCGHPIIILYGKVMHRHYLKYEVHTKKCYNNCKCLKPELKELLEK